MKTNCSQADEKKIWLPPKEKHMAYSVVGVLCFKFADFYQSIQIRCHSNDDRII